MFNPYKRLEELNKEIDRFEAEIKYCKNPKKKKELETDQFWLILEQIPIDKTIKYFEKGSKNVKRKRM